MRERNTLQLETLSERLATCSDGLGQWWTDANPLPGSRRHHTQTARRGSLGSVSVRAAASGLHLHGTARLRLQLFPTSDLRDRALKVGTRAPFSPTRPRFTRGKREPRRPDSRGFYQAEGLSFPFNGPRLPEKRHRRTPRGRDAPRVRMHGLLGGHRSSDCFSRMVKHVCLGRGTFVAPPAFTFVWPAGRKICSVSFHSFFQPTPCTKPSLLKNCHARNSAEPRFSYKYLHTKIPVSLLQTEVSAL